jgi:hypothetical protein
MRDMLTNLSLADLERIQKAASEHDGEFGITAQMVKEAIEIKLKEREEREWTVKEIDGIKVRRGMRVGGLTGEYWTTWVLLPSGDLPLVKAIDIAEQAGIIDWEHHSGIPGDRFVDRPQVRIGRSRTLVTQRGGWDV